mgnify:CR=1 FL=1
MTYIPFSNLLLLNDFSFVLVRIDAYNNRAAPVVEW